MTTSIKATRRWWREGKNHKSGKNILRAACKKYGASCVEEERFPVDLHDIDPELYPKKAVRGYQADLLVIKKRGKEEYRVIAEVDGGYHENRKEKDAIRDIAIPRVYGLQVVRFDEEKLLRGEITEEQIAEKLGL